MVVVWWYDMGAFMPAVQAEPTAVPRMSTIKVRGTAIKTLRASEEPLQRVSSEMMSLSSRWTLDCR